MDILIYLTRYIFNLLSLLSILVNGVVFFGRAGEALSERCGRHQLEDEYNSKFWGYYFRILIDTLLFFDKAEIDGVKVGHCGKSHLLETSGEVFRKIEKKGK